MCVQVFKRAYIPRTLTDVKHYERDVDLMLKLKEEDQALGAQQDTVSDLSVHANSHIWGGRSGAGVLGPCGS